METHTRELEVFEAELLHWEQLLTSEEGTAADVTRGERAVIQKLGPKVAEARIRYEAARAASDHDYSARRADLKEQFKDIRESFKRLDAKHSDWVPLS